MSANNAPNGFQQPNSAINDYNAHTFHIRQIQSQIATSIPCRVVAVTNNGGVAATGTVDVQPLVNQIDGNGNPTPHGVLHGLPYQRLFGGTNAVIIDPQVGDIGTVVFASHDISKVVNTGAQANPGSRRRFDMADGIYQAGGILGQTPTQYVQVNSSGIAIVSPNKVTIQAPTVAVTGNLTVSGTVVAQGDVTAGTVTLQTHIHTGVQPGSGVTGPPEG